MENGNTTLSPAQRGLLNYVNKFAYSYNPLGGYEPYWPEGERVLEDKSMLTMGPGGSTNTPKSTTQPPYPMVCGLPCPENYRRIKHVCTHHTSNNKMSGCMYHPLSDDWKNEHCWNIKPDTFDDPFHEFETYCEFLKETCKEHFTSPKYILLHIGKCKDEHFWFKDLSDNSHVLNRMTEYPLAGQETKHFDLNKKGTHRRRTTQDPTYA
ncbi:unnamed protein product [Arctia plantaginis]|uniref:Uncharacterized protein n=1 Tax=Arctia plantaginis TaxID=874455 RepID=A0A8S0ZTL4_ARCPL|nr:unnamed protein product [Arctia plantaginis]